ncbi:conserved hypothetical protein [Beggiatoa sp. PS]|nr:conserved hypothetical protein [Beggiatoa sp. PS]
MGRFNYIAGIKLCNITPEIMLPTINCLENSSLHAMDALHIGCALVYAPDEFVSADKRQIQGNSSYPSSRTDSGRNLD